MSLTKLLLHHEHTHTHTQTPSIHPKCNAHQLGFDSQAAAIVRSRSFIVGPAGARSIGVQMCGSRGVGGVLRGQRHFSLFDIEEEDGAGEEEGEEEEEEDGEDD